MKGVVRLIGHIVKWVVILVTTFAIGGLLELMLDVTHYVAGLLMLICGIVGYLSAKLDDLTAQAKNQNLAHRTPKTEGEA